MINFSLEIFPPKTAQTSLSLWKAINVYEQLSPSYISVTCHGAGTKLGLTRELVSAIQARNATPVAPHMVCSNQTKEEIKDLADFYWKNGVRKIVALRGDLSSEGNNGEFPYAIDLVKFLKSLYDFKIFVAGYPEKHPESMSQKDDIDRLKEKTDAGANAVISQFFFDPDVFLRYRDSAASAGVKCDIIPGILPILNFRNMIKFAEKCQAKVPEFLFRMFEGSDPDDQMSQKLLAMNVLTHQITRLIDHGVNDFHFYTLNELTLTSQTCRWLKTAF